MLKTIQGYLLNGGGFLLTKFANRENCELYLGNVRHVNDIADLQNNCQNDGQYVFAIPFCHIYEKYPNLPKSNKKIPLIIVKKTEEFAINSESFGCAASIVVKNAKFTDTDEEYKQKVRDVVEKEINNGEGSNFLISRKMTGEIEDFSLLHALELFAKLVETECGYYQVFCFFDGEVFLIGASPECHINIKNNQIRMQPISGTYRKKNAEITEEKQEFLKFLNDKKEINELFMVTDEELKMMAKMCKKGGRVIGPRLREMSKVIHTEYFLTGETDMGIFDCIRQSMHAATVVGAPLENAFKIGQKYNPQPNYFCSQVGIYTKNNAEQSFDSSILIRTIELDNFGNFQLYAGATVVKNSNPESELLEVTAKLSRMLDTLTLEKAQKPRQILPYLLYDHDIQEALYIRNRYLSKFWMFEQTNLINGGIFHGKTAVIIDNEDDFTNMQAHIFEKLGLNVKIVHYSCYKYENEDVTIVGPGPGNPNDKTCSKMQIIRNISLNLLENKRKFLSICLGHQSLCRALGIEVKRGVDVMQGEQVIVDFFGENQCVGMYNTFFGIKDKNYENIEFCLDENKQIYAMRGEGFFSVQFHPESVLTIDGFEIISNMLSYIFI